MIRLLAGRTCSTGTQLLNTAPPTRLRARRAYQGSVVLIARHGKVCYFKAFGKADEGVPMATDSIFRLASMSKVVAAACVMQLRARR